MYKSGEQGRMNVVRLVICISDDTLTLIIFQAWLRLLLRQAPP